MSHNKIWNSYIHHFIFISPAYITNQFLTTSRLACKLLLVGALHWYCRGQGSNRGKPEFFRTFFSQLHIKVASFISCAELLCIYFSDKSGTKQLTQGFHRPAPVFNTNKCLFAVAIALLDLYVFVVIKIFLLWLLQRLQGTKLAPERVVARAWLERFGQGLGRGQAEMVPKGSSSHFGAEFFYARLSLILG